MNQVSKIVGKNIRAERVQRNLSQKEVAKIAYMNRASISHMESGYSCPPIETLKKLSDAIGCSMFDLLKGLN